MQVADFVSSMQDLQESWMLPGLQATVTGLSCHGMFLFAASRSGAILFYDCTLTGTAATAPVLLASFMLSRAAQVIAAGDTFLYVANGDSVIECLPWTSTGGAQASIRQVL